VPAIFEVHLEAAPEHVAKRRESVSDAVLSRDLEGFGRHGVLRPQQRTDCGAAENEDREKAEPGLPVCKPHQPQTVSAGVEVGVVHPDVS
jgi:hypothetical protein